MSALRCMSACSVGPPSCRRLQPIQVISDEDGAKAYGNTGQATVGQAKRSSLESACLRSQMHTSGLVGWIKSDLALKITSIASNTAWINGYKSPGPDGIHPRILYETRNIITAPLKKIFETSLLLTIGERQIFQPYIKRAINQNSVITVLSVWLVLSVNLWKK